MSKEFDLCIFGASGFTGKFVLQAWLRLSASEPEAKGLKLAIAGRSRSKLEDTLRWANAEEAQVPIILADVNHEDSLAAMCKQTKLVLNCVGPYRLINAYISPLHHFCQTFERIQYKTLCAKLHETLRRYWGEPVVKACVQQGTDYIDISGEPEFMERMELSYIDRARKSGALIVSACGFDCIPAELGVLHAINQFPPPGAPHSVESFLSFRASHGFKANYGTWESLVQGIGSAEKLRKLRASQEKPPPLPVPGKAPRRKGSPYFEPRVRAYAVPFPAADASVVKRTMQRFSRDLTERNGNVVSPAHYAAYFTVPSWWYLFVTSVYGVVLNSLAKFEWGRNLLLKFPGFFSHGIFSREGPSQRQIEGTSTTFLLFTKGFKSVADRDFSAPEPDKHVITKVHTPEPGYAATSTIMICCALSLLRSRVDLPTGGVFTPGYVFCNSDLGDRLNRNGITFSVVSDEDA